MDPNLNDYIEIARQTKRIHKALLSLLELTSKVFPSETIHPLFKMEDYLFLFKERAENQMLVDCPEVATLHTDDYPDFTHIFYGGFKDIE